MTFQALLKFKKPKFIKCIFALHELNDFVSNMVEYCSTQFHIVITASSSKINSSCNKLSELYLDMLKLIVDDDCYDNYNAMVAISRSIFVPLSTIYRTFINFDVLQFHSQRRKVMLIVIRCIMLSIEGDDINNLCTVSLSILFNASFTQLDTFQDANTNDDEIFVGFFIIIIYAYLRKLMNQIKCAKIPIIAIWRGKIRANKQERIKSLLTSIKLRLTQPRILRLLCNVSVYGSCKEHIFHDFSKKIQISAQYILKWVMMSSKVYNRNNAKVSNNGLLALLQSSSVILLHSTITDCKKEYSEKNMAAALLFEIVVALKKVFDLGYVNVERSNGDRSDTCKEVCIEKFLSKLTMMNDQNKCEHGAQENLSEEELSTSYLSLILLCNYDKMLRSLFFPRIETLNGLTANLQLLTSLLFQSRHIGENFSLSIHAVLIKLLSPMISSVCYQKKAVLSILYDSYETKTSTSIETKVEKHDYEISQRKSILILSFKEVPFRTKIEVPCSTNYLHHVVPKLAKEVS